jgi:hypothetical protein
MTALHQYSRLEAAGLWRSAPDAQRREVIVGLRDATIILIDPKTEGPLTQWSLPAIERIGGANGWYACNWLWQLRGWMDTMIGGPGMARGRQHPDRVDAGEKLDCWHVELCERPRRLRLAAEMKMPGRGWLEFEVVPRDGDVTIHQTAIFDPRGVGGLAYWYAIWPLHELVFRRMLAGIARFAVRGR